MAIIALACTPFSVAAPIRVRRQDTLAPVQAYEPQARGLAARAAEVKQAARAVALPSHSSEYKRQSNDTATDSGADLVVTGT